MRVPEPHRFDAGGIDGDRCIVGKDMILGPQPCCRRRLKILRLLAKIFVNHGRYRRLPQIEFRQNRKRLGGRRMVVGRRTRRDQVQGIAEHVGDDQADQSAGAASSQQSAPFDAAQLLANRVELDDVGSGGRQMPRDGKFVGQRNLRWRRRQQCRSAAGNQANAQVVGGERFNDPQNFERTGNPFGRWFVESRRPCRMQMDSRKRPHAIRRHVHPANQFFSSMIFGPSVSSSACRHPGPRLPRPDDGDSANAQQINWLRTRFRANSQPMPVKMHLLANQPLRPNRLQPGSPDLNRIGSQLGGGANHGQVGRSNKGDRRSIIHAMHFPPMRRYLRARIRVAEGTGNIKPEKSVVVPLGYASLVGV